MPTGPRTAAPERQPARSATSRRPTPQPKAPRGGFRLDNHLFAIVAIVMSGLLVAIGWNIVSGGKKERPRPATLGVLGDLGTTSGTQAGGSVSDAVPADFGTAVRANPAGKLVEVKGPSARAVLSAYCGSRKDVELVPVGIVEAVPPNPRARVGLFRDMSQWDQPVRAITIWRDPRTREWVVEGRGDSPIFEHKPPLTVAPPPELAALAAERSDGSLKSMAEKADPAADRLSRPEGAAQPPTP